MLWASGEGMTCKKNYWETIAEHIAEVVGDRQIEDVLHFSRLENLSGILEHGLLSRSLLRNADYGVCVSDADRLDKEDDAISVSISCYYPKMTRSGTAQETSRGLSLSCIRAFCGITPAASTEMALRQMPRSTGAARRMAGSPSRSFSTISLCRRIRRRQVSALSTAFR